MTSNLGKWDPWYKDLTAEDKPQPYGASPTYEMGAQWLKDCAVVEDWGCGLGWAKQYYRPDQYFGVDGTKSPYADVVADLALYVPSDAAPGIFMRGVIEHDYRWDLILANAYRSFTQRMCLVLFTPMVRVGPWQQAFVESIGVPDLSFSYFNIVGPMQDAGILRWETETIASPNTGYGVETIFYLEK
jgi:hypothetical protein